MNSRKFMTVCLSLFLLFSTAACTKSSQSTASKDSNTNVVKVKQVIGWYPGPEFGGQYAALLNNYYKDAGLDVTIQPGGANVSPVQIVASGQAQFGIAQSYDIIQARNNGIPLVAVAAIFQKSPQALLFHGETPITNYSDLNGKTIILTPGSAYWQYIKKKYNIQAQEVAYNGTPNLFLTDKNAVQQGYATNEPYYIGQKGVDVKYKLNSDSGFDPYPDVIFTTEKYAKEHPDQVKAFIQASLKGWNDYLQSPTAINEEMKKSNKDLDLGGAAYGAKTEVPFIMDGDAKDNGIGYMSDQRWEDLSKAMKFAGLIKDDFDVKTAYTTIFLQK